MKRLDKICSFLLIFLLLSCSRGQHQKQIDVFQDGMHAQWICDGRPLPASDSLFYCDRPAPLFRKEFMTSSRIHNARLYITAAGYYRASLNGKEVGQNVLDPDWTDFSKRIYYAEYDLTSSLEEGLNCLGVALGNGFYNPLPLRKWGRRNLREDLKVGKPVFIAKLRITYDNGTTEEIVSDQSWKHAFGPLSKNSVYLGVSYDARKELQDWNRAGYNDASWLAARTGSSPGGELQAAFSPPVRVIREIHPKGISSPEAGIYLVDMGEVLTGTYRIRLSGETGDSIIFRFGERIYPDGSLNPMTTVIGQIKAPGVGGPGAPPIAWQTDQYVIGEEKQAWFTPPFTYHTYRYMEIRGLEKEPRAGVVSGLSIHSDIPSRGSFTCSSPLLNGIQESVLRTFRANLVSVQSDCAAREKFGYGGDLNATSESMICNLEMHEFYLKTLYDWVDAMKDSSFVDTAPFAGIEYCGISWESAFLLTQYYLYLYYGDTTIVEEFYELDRQWMAKAARIHPGGLVDSGLSDHESLEPVPVQLTGTCHYLQCAQVMSTFARITGDTIAQKKYKHLAGQLRELVKRKFWDNPYQGEINRQTLFSTLLYHGIIPEEETGAAADSLLAAVKQGPSGHFNTGIFGTKYILETLSEYISSQEVFDIVNSTDYPGWGHMIDRGATTIWETWKESDNTYSNCHPMFGSVSEWFYRWLGGIRCDPAFPGFSEFILAPSFPDGLDSVRCKYQSPHGEIVSAWSRMEGNVLRFEADIPEGSRARVSLPVDSGSEISLVRTGESEDPGRNGNIQSGKFVLYPGKYLISLYF